MGMIINTGQRTDIPAFYSKWFANRLKDGFVCVRNPYNPSQVSRYRLDPSVVDCIGFCTKNPVPMFEYMDLLQTYGQFWYVTITPYGRDIEPNVPDKHKLLDDFCELSDLVGVNRVGWRYDPIFISRKYSYDYHLRAFETMASALDGYTDNVVISFIDLYAKVKRNFPEVQEVEEADRLSLGKAIIAIAKSHHMVVRPCGEGTELEQFGADCGGCMTIPIYERAIGYKLNVPPFKPSRNNCGCYISCDIGAYDTCQHMCRYCYANNDYDAVRRNARKHNPSSPFLIGDIQSGDVVHDVEQYSFKDSQLPLFSL